MIQVFKLLMRAQWKDSTIAFYIFDENFSIGISKISLEKQN